jgi:uncharacterized membrane protein YkvA (DUF1232 family)
VQALFVKATRPIVMEEKLNLRFRFRAEISLGMRFRLIRKRAVGTMGAMETINLSRALIPAAGQERLVRNRFWDKVRETLGRVPFLDRALAAYYAAIDPATPSHVKAILFAALAYFVMPADMIPDFIAGFGYSDDAAVLLAVMRTLSPHIGEAHIARARDFLACKPPSG